MHALNCFVTEFCSICTGKGVLGLSVPGCPETFEQPQSSRSRQGSRHQEQQQQQPDSHQKIRRFYRGDVIAIPAGTPYWTYNHGQEPIVAISLLDTSSFVNQLDSTPRVSISITIHYIMCYRFYFYDAVAETYKTFIQFTNVYKIFNSINHM